MLIFFFGCRVFTLPALLPSPLAGTVLGMEEDFLLVAKVELDPNPKVTSPRPMIPSSDPPLADISPVRFNAPALE